MDRGDPVIIDRRYGGVSAANHGKNILSKFSDYVIRCGFFDSESKRVRDNFTEIRHVCRLA